MARQYVMYQFRTGECRLEPVTPKRPAKVIEAELMAKWPRQGYIIRGIDVTRNLEQSGFNVPLGKPRWADRPDK